MYIECNVHQSDMPSCLPNDNGTKVCIVLYFCGISILWFSQLEKILYTKIEKLTLFGLIHKILTPQKPTIKVLS